MYGGRLRLEFLALSHFPQEFHASRLKRKVKLPDRLTKLWALSPAGCGPGFKPASKRGLETSKPLKMSGNGEIPQKDLATGSRQPGRCLPCELSSITKRAKPNQPPPPLGRPALDLIYSISNNKAEAWANRSSTLGCGLNWLFLGWSESPFVGQKVGA